MKSRAVFLFLACLLLAVAVAAQAQKPLTNDDVVQMTKAGFDESTIVKAIQANEPNFDTSVDGLIALRSAGVTKPIIDAILEAQANAKTRANAPLGQAPEPVPGLPKAPGVYYQNAAGWVQLPDASMRQVKSTGLFGSVTSLGKMSVYYVYRGAHATAQFMTPQPVFYVRSLGKSGRDVQIIRLEVKKDSRTVQFASASALKSSSSIDDKNIQIPTVTSLGADILWVTPAAALAAGEYLLSVDADHGYDFGIAPERLR